MTVKRAPAPIANYALKAYPAPSRYDQDAYPKRVLTSGGTGGFNTAYRYGAKRARLVIEVVSDTLADYDGFAFTLTYPLETAIGATASQGYTFDDDASPPTTGATIKIMGLTTKTQIAAQIVLALNLTALASNSKGFKAWTMPGKPTFIIVEQLYGGKRGNALATFPAAFNAVLLVNGVSQELEQTAYHFLGGADFNAPARVGPAPALNPRGSSETS